MAGFKKTLPMSRALRQGGEGTVAPPKAASGPPKNLGAAAKPSGIIGKAMPKEPKLPKLPKFK